MICIVQRVTEAKVTVDHEIVGQIGPGLLVLAAVERDDTLADAQWTADKLVCLRIFRCCEKHFDVDVKQIGGSVLLVSNFTVAADTRRGRRPSFDGAMDPKLAEPIFEKLVEAVRQHGIPVQTGRFGASMLVSCTNDGPATFIVRTDRPPQKMNV
ncbi:D-aminoacyl-tRNA deacylase [Fontivita pretiosa]|jgi:D-tyrosyl-tRNA(Tyr) deacylase|uniref:D-aminoacyl-tRNA deacylase n=1 Tax=Fontivita pretiosa TaxID=2989684 RepID=UPI003D18521A